MLDFAERTGSGIIIVVWSLLLSMLKIDTMISSPPPFLANSLASSLSSIKRTFFKESTIHKQLIHSQKKNKLPWCHQQPTSSHYLILLLTALPLATSHCRQAGDNAADGPKRLPLAKPWHSKSIINSIWIWNFQNCLQTPAGIGIALGAAAGNNLGSFEIEAAAAAANAWQTSN
jgi:hypothetical protein